MLTLALLTSTLALAEEHPTYRVTKQIELDDPALLVATVGDRIVAVTHKSAITLVIGADSRTELEYDSERRYMPRALVPDGSQIAMASKEGGVAVLSLPSMALATRTVSDQKLVDVSASAGGLAAVDKKGTVVVWDADGDELYRHTELNKAPATQLSVAADGKMVAYWAGSMTGGDGYVLRGENVSTREAVPNLFDMAISPEGDRLATVDSTGLKLWNPDGFEQLHSVSWEELEGMLGTPPAGTEVDGAPLTSVSFSDDGRVVLVGTSKAQALLLDASTGAPLTRHSFGTPCKVSSAAAGERWVAVACGQNVGVWTRK